MAFYPDKNNPMRLFGFQKPFPKIYIFYRFLFTTDPSFPVSVEEWKKEWELINSVILEMNQKLDNYTQDSVEMCIRDRPQGGRFHIDQRGVAGIGDGDLPD